MKKGLFNPTSETEEMKIKLKLINQNRHETFYMARDLQIHFTVPLF